MQRNVTPTRTRPHLWWHEGNTYSISSKRSWNFHCLIFHFIRTTNLKRKELVFLWLIFSDEKSPSFKLWTVNTDPLVRNWDVFLHSFASTSSPGWALNLDFTKHTSCFCRLFWRKTYILDCLVELYIIFQVVLHSFRSKLLRVAIKAIKGFPLTNKCSYKNI